MSTAPAQFSRIRDAIAGDDSADGFGDVVGEVLRRRLPARLMFRDERERRW